VLGTVPVDLRPYEYSALESYREALKAHSGWQRRGRKKE
jgi:hypothetical protein